MTNSSTESKLRGKNKGKNETVNNVLTALLVKCGIKPSKMVILPGHSNGAIVSRREAQSVKIFDEKKSLKVIDGIIRLL